MTAPAESSPATCSYLDDDWRLRYARGRCLRIGPEPQLLLDDYLVADTFNLRRLAVTPQKHPHNPLVSPDQPWEQSLANPNVLYDEADGLYKMWYGVHNSEGTRVAGQPGLFTYKLAYATSRDRIHWDKPDLDLVRDEAGRPTNLLMTGRHKVQAFQVDFNPDTSDPRRRFVMTYKDLPAGSDDVAILLAYSADGLRWQEDEDPVILRGCNDGAYHRVYDPQRRRWLMYRRPMTLAVRPGHGRVHDLNPWRRASVCLSDDMRNWTQPAPLTLLDDTDIDLADVDDIHVFRAGGMFLGSMGIMDNRADEPQRPYLIYSRDGLTWGRLAHHPPFIPLGDDGQWDSGEISRFSVLPAGRKTYVYYRGADGPQGARGRATGIGACWVERDRWVGWGDVKGYGFLLTRRVLVEGEDLVVNAASTAKRGTRLQAEVLCPPAGDEHTTAEPYPGFSFADFQPVSRRGADRLVLRWTGGPIGKLRGRAVMIRFYVENFALYAMSITDRPEPDAGA